MNLFIYLFLVGIVIIKLNADTVIDVTIELCGADATQIETDVITILDYFETIEPECGTNTEVTCTINNIDINSVTGICTNNQNPSGGTTGSEIIIVIQSTNDEYISPSLTNITSSQTTYETKLQEWDTDVTINKFDPILRSNTDTISRIGTARVGYVFYTCLIISVLLLVLGILVYIRGTYCKKEKDIHDPIAERYSTMVATGLTLDPYSRFADFDDLENDTNKDTTEKRENSYGFSDSTTNEINHPNNNENDNEMKDENDNNDDNINDSIANHIIDDIKEIKLIRKETEYNDNNKHDNKSDSWDSPVIKPLKQARMNLKPVGRNITRTQSAVITPFKKPKKIQERKRQTRVYIPYNF